jgi:hypothetical protein
MLYQSLKQNKAQPPRVKYVEKRDSQLINFCARTGIAKSNSHVHVIHKKLRRQTSAGLERSYTHTYLNKLIVSFVDRDVRQIIEFGSLC